MPALKRGISYRPFLQTFHAAPKGAFSTRATFAWTVAINARVIARDFKGHRPNNPLRRGLDGTSRSRADWLPRHAGGGKLRSTQSPGASLVPTFASSDCRKGCFGTLTMTSGVGMAIPAGHYQPIISCGFAYLYFTMFLSVRQDF